ncbi:MAG: calcineurin-like phosphoesterase family protein [Pseudomonadales bacterium]|jgi:hypothetical protein|nr:calcineurin-like phosphoesterase family protein [Pseudomonadales bacterium]MDP6470527.1 calcineurin-like phosphoesterase family protein [Pseudomonadales bacterium]MDP6827829.1 calcineurin-like phosphoesterase family protein [Pseudomonadales bacterium]MDP6972161.1 calcineurin-like phosphoesterase family protein [Pseudomonadales bacterium]
MYGQSPGGRLTARAGVVVLMLAAWSAHGADYANGYVFNDLNANGVRDAGEPGIGNVRVSDGENITATDGSGYYRLSIGGEAMIFIAKPRGYRTPVNAQQLPRFYYIHQPQGSPEGLRYPGVDPTGPLPDSVDFPLREHDEPSVFEAILLADTQPQTNVELDFIRDDVIAELIGTDARFGMTMGDIMFDDMSLFPRFNELIAQIGIPWYNVPGNHELNLLAASDEYSLETFKRFFGPPYYSFEYGDVLFVVLDNIEYHGNGRSAPGDVRGSGGYIANIGRRQLKWLKKELQYVPEDKLVFLAMHSPLATYVSADGAGVNTADRKDLFKLLAGRPNLYSVAGHTHTTEHLYFDEDDGFRGPGAFHHHVLSTVSGSWWSGPFDDRGIPTTWQRDGTPNGYHVLQVDGTEASVRFKAASQPADYQMRILFDVAHHGIRADGLRDYREGELFDGLISLAEVPAASVLVNLFDGGPRSKLSFRIDGGASISMQRISRIDPYIFELFTRHEESKKSGVQAAPSSHLFEADLPDDLGPGIYTLSVEAVDEFGVTHHAHTVLEISAGS